MKINYAYILKNDSLAKINQISRLGLELNSKNFFCHIQKTKTNSFFRNSLYSSFYNLFILFSLITLIISRPIKIAPSKCFFLIHDPRLKKFSSEKNKFFYVGLHRFVKNKALHSYSILTKKELFKCIKDSITDFKHKKSHILALSNFLNVDEKSAEKISGFNILKIIDIRLAAAAIKKLQNVEFAGHFDIYTSIASFLRENDEISLLQGNQHGLLEKFKSSSPQKLFFDRYVLLFNESIDYVVEKYISNKFCKILVRTSQINSFEKSDAYSNFAAVAMQNDSYEKDFELINAVLKNYGSNIMLYIHPAAPDNIVKEIKEKYPKILVEKKARFDKIKVIITRYSTMGLDYQKNGTPAIFFLKDDDICISESNSINLFFCNNETSLAETLRKFSQ